MITVASTISPKSIAPTESKLADSPPNPRMTPTKHSPNGLAAPPLTAARASARTVPGRQCVAESGGAAAAPPQGAGGVVDGADQPAAAHHAGVGSHVPCVAADIDVGVVNRLQQLRQRQAVGDQLVEIDL